MGFKFFLALTVFVALWAVIIRPVLRKQPWAEPFFSIIEPFELALYRKSESLAWARYLGVLGMALTGLSQVDPTMVQAVAALLPEGLRWIGPVSPLALTLFGVVGEMLRRDVTKPLVLVEAPEASSAEVKDAIAQAEVTNTIAVETVKGST